MEQPKITRLIPCKHCKKRTEHILLLKESGAIYDWHCIECMTPAEQEKMKEAFALINEICSKKQKKALET